MTEPAALPLAEMVLLRRILFEVQALRADVAALCAKAPPTRVAIDLRDLARLLTAIAKAFGVSRDYGAAD